MARKSGAGKPGVLIAGLGFGVAAGLAAGVLLIAPNLPGGPSQTTGGGQPEPDAQEREAAEIDAAQADAADAVIDSLAEDAVAGTLEQRPVLVLRTEDAADDDVGNIRWLLDQAGAIDAGDITLNERFFSQDGADQLKSIVANTLPTGSQLSEESLDPGTHAGDALGAALLLDPETTEPRASGEERALVLESLAEAGYLEYEQGTILPAQGIILVTGDSDGSGEAAFSAGTLANFARTLGEQANGAVLAGRIQAAADTGAIGQLREEEAEQVSTVDSAERTWGRMAAVLALAEQFDGGAGAYGSANSATAGATPAINR